jgi:hypothetical protein
MSIQALLISVAVTLVTVGITFFYFRNRLNNTEKKVDLMFQLIQEHEKNSRISQQMQMQQMNTMNNNQNLINISDDEEGEEEDSEDDYDSDDSNVVSDSEEESKLIIQNVKKMEDNSLDNTVKTISLSLEGAETNHDNLDDNLDDLDEVELSDIESNQATVDSSEIQEEKSDDGTLNNFVVTKKMNPEEDQDSLDEQLSSDNIEEDDQEHDQEDDQEENHEDEQNSESNDENLEEIVTQEVKTVTSSINYSKLSKAQLKQLAQEKGLAGYNKLTKGGLVDLLNTSP